MYLLYNKNIGRHFNRLPHLKGRHSVATQLVTPSVPDEIASKGAIGKFCAIVALVLGVADIVVGCYLVTYSDRPTVALAALVVVVVGLVLALSTMAARPYYWQGNGTYRKSRFLVNVFIGEDGKLYPDDNPARPRPHWTDSRLAGGLSSFGLMFAASLMLAYAWGWLWV